MWIHLRLASDILFTPFQEEPEFSRHPQTVIAGGAATFCLWCQLALYSSLLVWWPELPPGPWCWGHLGLLWSSVFSPIRLLMSFLGQTLFWVIFMIICFGLTIAIFKFLHYVSLLCFRDQFLSCLTDGFSLLQDILKHVSKREFDELMYADQLTRERHKRKAFFNFSMDFLYSRHCFCLSIKIWIYNNFRMS